MQQRCPVLPAGETSSQQEQEEERRAAAINIDGSEPKDGHMPIALPGNPHLFREPLLRRTLPIIAQPDYGDQTRKW